MSEIVNIVHCIDTEGPLYESIEATFKRMTDLFGEIDLEPTYENLEKLRNEGNDEIAKFVSSELLDYKETWDQIDSMLTEIRSKEFRSELLDSFGNGWKYTWFCIDWVGFTGENPRRRDMGFHNIFDHYSKFKEDEIQFHIHPISIKKDAHLTGNTYSPIIYETLARRVIDRMWFPSAVRSGVERPDSHWFYEQWIPFNYGNSSMIQNSSEQRDLSDGHFGDWRHAPLEWLPYHPSYRDWQEKGECHRVIARCLNIEARVKEITIDDLREGFERASKGLPTLISFANHDYRDMKKEINKIRNMIKTVSNEYPEVKFRYCNAVEGIRNVMNMKEIKTPNINLSLKKDWHYSILTITTQNDIFGTQPFFCMKTRSGQYIWQNLDYQEKNRWTYTFDSYTLPIESIDKIGVATATNEGVCEVEILDMNTYLKKRCVLYE